MTGWGLVRERGIASTTRFFAPLRYTQNDIWGRCAAFGIEWGGRGIGSRIREDNG